MWKLCCRDVSQILSLLKAQGPAQVTTPGCRRGRNLGDVMHPRRGSGASTLSPVTIKCASLLISEPSFQFMSERSREEQFDRSRWMWRRYTLYLHRISEGEWERKEDLHRPRQQPFKGSCSQVELLKLRYKLMKSPQTEGCTNYSN
jgi:hypothetical protein